MNTECSPKLHCQLKLLLCRLLVRPATLLMLFFSSVFPSIVWRYLVPIVAALIPLVKNEMVSSQWYRTYMTYSTYGPLTLTTTLNLKSTTTTTKPSARPRTGIHDVYAFRLSPVRR